MRIISSPTETSLKPVTHGVAGVAEAANVVAGVAEADNGVAGVTGPANGTSGVTRAANGVAGVTGAANGTSGVRADGVGLTKGVALSSLSFAKASISMVARSSGRLSCISYCFCLICVEGPLTIPQICKAAIQISVSVKSI